MLGTSWWGPALGQVNRRLHDALTEVAEQVLAWPVTSQQQARRNAMVASTACARRRAEREDVAEFLAEHDAATAPGPRADLAPTGSPDAPGPVRATPEADDVRREPRTPRVHHG